MALLMDTGDAGDTEEPIGAIVAQMVERAGMLPCKPAVDQLVARVGSMMPDH